MGKTVGLGKEVKGDCGTGTANGAGCWSESQICEIEIVMQHGRDGQWISFAQQLGSHIFGGVSIMGIGDATQGPACAGEQTEPSQSDLTLRMELDQELDWGPASTFRSPPRRAIRILESCSPQLTVTGPGEHGLQGAGPPSGRKGPNSRRWSKNGGSKRRACACAFCMLQQQKMHLQVRESKKATRASSFYPLTN